MTDYVDTNRSSTEERLDRLEDDMRQLKETAALILRSFDDDPAQATGPS